MAGCLRRPRAPARSRARPPQGALPLAGTQAKIRRPDRALDSLQILTRVCPELPGLYEHRGSILLNLDRHQEALEDLDEALRREPKSRSVRRRRALALLGLEQHEAGLSELTALLDEEPDYPSALASRAQAQLDLGRYAEAETDLSRLLDPLSGRRGAFAWRALARTGLGRFEAAVEDWLRLTDEPFESCELNRAPKNLLALGNLPDTPAGLICAAFLHFLARRPGAVELANRAVQAQGDDWRWRWLRAEILERSGQLEAAREDYAAVLSHAQDASRRLAWCTLRAGHAQEALVAFQELPDDPDARLGRATAELALAGSQVEPLEALLGRLDELVEGELAAPAQALRGEALQRLGRPGEALNAYDESLCLSPSAHLPTLLGFARALLQEGHPEDALYCLRDALARDDTPATRADIAACLLRMGEAAEALMEAREALARFPDFAPAHLVAGRALVALGRPEEALEPACWLVEHQSKEAYSYLFRASVLIETKELEAARQDLEQADRLDLGSIPNLRGWLGFFAATEQYDRALVVVERLLELSPENRGALCELKEALEEAAQRAIG
ncbi:hypothetical protein DYH09_17700 [bacterium CPR1]|nr:hypothetical protein [bacterium CPR1]